MKKKTAPKEGLRIREKTNPFVFTAAQTIPTPPSSTPGRQMHPAVHICSRGKRRFSLLCGKACSSGVFNLLTEKFTLIYGYFFSPRGAG